LVNLAVAYVLSRDRDDLNVRAALVHVIGDLLGSVAALIAGVVITLGGPEWMDPLLSVLVCLLIAKSAVALLRQSYGILMEHVPQTVNFDAVAADLQALPGVSGVHNLHIWEISPGHIALTAHIELQTLESWPALRVNLQTMLRERHGIDHATVQPEILAPTD
jgi:cobalt-zinc-cadmium efflux system protein